ncbi:hypothetical protein [Agrococcus sp. KRD186]|uniref:hypothetical protein n=1 Tax=Agrococcus sp. KRD186 TaxID=2729730 RepID=UPI0019D13566|nr:hypothetical protein [Agrococcus sp. KRD186]
MTTPQLPELPTGTAARIEQRLLTAAAGARQTHQRRNRAIAGGAALVLLAGTGVAAVTIASQAAQERSAHCYAAADTSSLSTQVGIPDEVTDSNGTTLPIRADSDRAAQALDLCGSVWRVGFFATDGVPVDDGRQHEVPPLTACLRADQVIAVFPGSDEQLCESVGLRPVP